MAEPTDAEMIAWCEDFAEGAAPYSPDDADMARAIAARLRQGSEGR